MDMHKAEEGCPVDEARAANVLAHITWRVVTNEIRKGAPMEWLVAHSWLYWWVSFFISLFLGWFSLEIHRVVLQEHETHILETRREGQQQQQGTHHVDQQRRQTTRAGINKPLLWQQRLTNFVGAMVGFIVLWPLFLQYRGCLADGCPPSEAGWWVVFYGWIAFLGITGYLPQAVIGSMQSVLGAATAVAKIIADWLTK
jgi:hypothetical protein